MDVSHVLGIAAAVGGYTSHSAIISRSYGIPAILGIPDLLHNVRDGDVVILDACEGKLLTGLDNRQLDLYTKKREQFAAEASDLLQYLKNDARTKNGVRIDIGLNIGSSREDELAGADYSDYVGLFRTEFLYMNSSSCPDEECQFRAYRKVLEAYGDRPVTLRTLDIGGDKTLPYMELPREDNPFLGCRALRLSFEREEVFRTQLRAALRASVYGNLWIMLPMVASLDDVRRAKKLIDSVKKELSAQALPYSDTVKVGVMIEIPSAALIADLLAKEVDFASIGTNDLCQYLTATDRLNPTVSEYYQSCHPAMFRLAAYVIDAFNKARKPISVCGEMGGDCLFAPVLVGLGLRKLSMSGSAVAGIKKVLSRLTTIEMKEMADWVLCCPTAGEISRYLSERINNIYTE